MDLHHLLLAGLPAHSGIPPYQIEREREQAKDQDPRGIDGEESWRTAGRRRPIASTTTSKISSTCHRRELRTGTENLRKVGVVSVIKPPAQELRSS
jgi:hypothetical protein